MKGLIEDLEIQRLAATRSGSPELLPALAARALTTLHIPRMGNV